MLVIHVAVLHGVEERSTMVESEKE